MRCLAILGSLSLLCLHGCGFRSEYTSGNLLTGAPLKATSRPYQIKGIWYYPQHHYEYDEMGIASWYGPGFHGKKTATAEVFDMYKITAAHKTLPLPCVAVVTNLENGRMLKVKINDRGPFVTGRIIDLSKKAAQLLGIYDKGTAKVRVQTLVEESIALATTSDLKKAAAVELASAPTGRIQSQSLMPTSKNAKNRQARSEPSQTDLFAGLTSQEAGGWETPRQGMAQPYRQLYVQAGSFVQKANADRLAAQLKRYGPTSVRYGYIGRQAFYRVRLGPFSSVEQADRALRFVVQGGIHDAKLTVD